MADVINAIMNFFGSSLEGQMEAGQFLMTWKESDSAGPMCLEFLKEKNPPQVYFIAAQVLQHFIRYNLAQESFSSFIPLATEILMSFLKNHITEFETSFYRFSLIALADLTILQPELLNLSVNFSERVLQLFIVFILEEFDQPFVFQRKIALPVKQAVLSHFEMYYDVLRTTSLSPEWLRLHYLLILNSETHDPFNVFLPNLNDAIENPCYYQGIYNIIYYVLHLKEENIHSFIYFKEIVKLAMNFLEYLRSLDWNNDEQIYLLMMNILYCLFTIKDKIFANEEIYGSLFPFFIFILPQVVAPVFDFVEILSSLAELLRNLSNNVPQTEELISFSLAFICSLISSCHPIFLSAEVQGIVQDLFYASPSIFHSFLDLNVNNPSLFHGILFMISSASIEYRLKICDFFTGLVVERYSKQEQQKPPTICHFAVSTGIYSEKYISSLIPILFQMIPEHILEISNCILEFSRIKPMVLLPYLNQIISFFNSDNIFSTINFISAIFGLLKYENFLNNPNFLIVPNYLTQFISLAINSHDINKIDEALKSLCTIINSSSFNETYKNFLQSIFQETFHILHPLLLLNDNTIQNRLCNVFCSFIAHEWIDLDHKNMILQWLITVLKVAPISEHFHVLKFLDELLLNEEMHQIIISLNLDDDFSVTCGLINFVQSLFEHHWPFFTSYFPEDWLIHLLTVKSIAPLNAVLDLFVLIADPPKDGSPLPFPKDFYINLIHSFFEDMKSRYKKFQIHKVLLICEKLSDVIQTNELASLFISHFNNPSDKIILIADRISKGLFDEYTELALISLFISHYI